MKDNPEVQELTTHVRKYNDTLASYGLKDYQVADLEFGQNKHPKYLVLIRILYLTCVLIVSLPGFIINIPVPIIAKYLALQEAKKALQGSDVKIEGKDVIASYKVLTSLVMIPALYTFYYLLILIFYGFNAMLVSMIILPLISFATVKMLEEGILVLKSFLPLLYAVLGSNYQKQLSEIRSNREKLQILTRDLVEKLGPEMGEQFWQKRVVDPELIAEELQHKDDISHQSVLKLKRTKYKTGDPWDDFAQEEIWQDVLYNA